MQDMSRISPSEERRPVVVLATVAGILAVLFGGGVYVYSQFASIPYGCAEQSETVSQTGKYRIEITQKACGGIAFSDTTFLALRSEQNDQPTTFFSYGGGSSRPTLNWASDNVLIVELPDVSEIYTQADYVGDVQIRYQIGKISTKQPRQRHSRSWDELSEVHA
jgi:hypothetical protein